MYFKETKKDVLEIEDGVCFPIRVWLPKKAPKAIFLAIHGGMAHAGDWVTPALFFAEKGFATVAFDLWGHGNFPKHNKKCKLLLHIDSFEDYIDSTKCVLDYIKKEYQKTPVFILGHSLGGLISLNYGLTKAKGEKAIKGFIVSSPWLKNIVGIPPILKALSKVFSVIYPKLPSPADLNIDDLTRDKTIKKRHLKDEKGGLRGTKGTPRFLIEAEKAQEWTSENLKNWKKFPLFVVIAGKDKLADSEFSEKALEKVPKKLVTLVKYEDNYHENFNELNREEIFNKIHKWMLPLMK